MNHRSRRKRHQRLGGSDCAAVMGLDPHKSAFDVWAEKCSRGLPFKGNKYTYWGKALEPVLARKYAQDHGVKLISSPPREAIDKPWLTGTPDRLILGDEVEDKVSKKKLLKRGVEFKTGNARSALKWGPSFRILRTYESAKSHIPMNYWAQCQWYMHLMNFPEWDLVVKLDSAEYREYRLDYDEDWMREAVERCERFWLDYVEPKRPPPLDWGRACGRYLNSIYDEYTDEIRPAQAFEQILIEDWKEVNQRIEHTKNQYDFSVRELRDLEEQITHLRKTEAELKKNEEAIKSILRERIARDAGIKTEKGDVVTWTKPRTEKTQNRIMRKRFI